MPSIKPDGSVNSVPQSDSNGLVPQYAPPPPLQQHFTQKAIQIQFQKHAPRNAPLIAQHDA
jgi:hypothetical protein